MPPRRRTKAFQENPNLENDHFLALQLGWKSVAAMRKGLSRQEYVRWIVYFGRRAQDQELARAKAKKG